MQQTEAQLVIEYPPHVMRSSTRPALPSERESQGIDVAVGGNALVAQFAGIGDQTDSLGAAPTAPLITSA